MLLILNEVKQLLTRQNVNLLKQKNDFTSNQKYENYFTYILILILPYEINNAFSMINYFLNSPMFNLNQNVPAIVEKVDNVKLLFSLGKKVIRHNGSTPVECSHSQTFVYF